MLNRTKSFALVLLATLLLLTRAASAQDDPQELDFSLTFIPNIQFAPLYVAIAQGYFAEEGLNLIVEYGDEPVLVDLVAAGQLEFAVISGEQVILARAGQRPVVFVYEWFQRYPVGIVVPDTTGAATITELEGRRIGIPGLFGASYTGLVALLSANDMDETDIQLEAIGFNAPDIVCAGGVDAAVVYVNNEPLQIQQRADAGQCGDITSVVVIPVASFADMVSNGLVTSEALIAENPELVAAVVRAFDRGLRDVINNPAEAYLLSLDFVENLPISRDLRALLEQAAEDQHEFLQTLPAREDVALTRLELLARIHALALEPDEITQFEVLLETIRLWDVELLGATDPESWELTRDVLAQMGMLVGEPDLAGAFTNEFVPALGGE